jgi:hypothetical protein
VVRTVVLQFRVIDEICNVVDCGQFPFHGCETLLIAVNIPLRFARGF